MNLIVYNVYVVELLGHLEIAWRAALMMLPTLITLALSYSGGGGCVTVPHALSKSPLLYSPMPTAAALCEHHITPVYP